MQSLLQNLRYALRQLRRSPGFTLTVVLTLALGIGANAAVFTLFDQALLRMLPVQQPRQLVRFEWTGDFSGSMSSFGGDVQNYFSYPMYKDLRDKNQVFSGILAADKTNVGVSWNNQAEDEDAELVSGNYFQLLGLQPALGRLLSPQDDTAKNANPQLVLSYAYWKARFAASPAIIGQSIRINGHLFTIVGVAPESFQTAIGGYKPSLFLPISMSEIAMPSTIARDNLNNHQSIWLTLIARLQPGRTMPQAEASLASLWHTLRAQELTLYTPPPTARFAKGFVEKSHLLVRDDSRGFSPNRMDLKTPLIILMSMAGLLVAMCAINVATLLLLRSAARTREMAMRYALGAARSRIISQLFLEGGVLGLAGALAGLAVAPLVANFLVRLMTHADPGSEPYSSAIDSRILAFTLAISVLASILFSLAPVLHFLRPDLVNALRQSADTASKGSQRFRKFAVGVQIALSVLLLGAAGLFVRTLDNLRHQPVGFDTTRLATFGLDPTNSGYGEDRTSQIITNTLDALSRIPGVSFAAATTDPELTVDTGSMDGFAIQGHKAAEGESRGFEAPWITASYFATLHQPILAGREFTAADVKGSSKVAVVNLAFAKRIYGTPQNALGGLITDEPRSKPDTTIVGVVGNIRHYDLRTELGPAVYRPYLQQEHPTGVVVYVQSVQSPETIEASIRRTVHDVDPTLVVDGLRTMEAQADMVSSGERALAILAVGFSVLALVLAAVGLYGVLAYSTEQRTREIGIRLALGAQRRSIIVAVLREMVIIAAVATVIALPFIGVLARFFRSQLYGVTVFDPVTLAATTALIVVMVVLAAVIPARRAATVQPMQALRTE
jgi:putative ABC transport system permease protein